MTKLSIIDMYLARNEKQTHILHLVTFTFKLAKHKMATKMLRKPHIFYSLSHMKVQFMFLQDFFN